MLDINFAQIFIAFAVLLFSLTVHEMEHAWTADPLGDPTARLLGRVSLNPLVHADLIGTVIFPLVAMVSGAPLIGWATRDVDDPANDVCRCRRAILRTTDGGETWDEVGAPSVQPNSMTFVDARRGWAVGYDAGTANLPAVIATEDGGATWANELTPQGFSGGALVARDGRMWLLSQLSGDPFLAGHTVIYRRDFAPEPAPPSTPRPRPPDTGAGPRGGSPLAGIAVLLAVMGAAAVTAAMRARRGAK